MYYSTNNNLSHNSINKDMLYETGNPDKDYLFTKSPKDKFYQNSEELDILENFRLNSCNFMAYLFMVQDYTNYNFSASEICYLAEFAQKEVNPANKNENCLTDEFNVRNPDIIMNKSFELARHKELYATVNWGAEDGQEPDYTNILCKTDLGNLHHVSGDGKQNIIYIILGKME